MFDAIVIGSGMSGGIAAKELCELGFKTLVLERGKRLEHISDYTDSLQPWDLPNAGRLTDYEAENVYPIQKNCYALNSATKHLWVKDSEHPYNSPAEAPFLWLRGNHLGGRSVMWGRQCYRLSEMDFQANSLDGTGTDWPIRYADLAPWYDRVEDFIGVSGSRDGLDQLPDGDFLPPMEMTDGEKFFKERVEATFPDRKVIHGRTANLTQPRDHHRELGRHPCQYRNLCERGCTFGAYHSSLTSSLPAAERTGNLTVETDSIVHSIEVDSSSGLAHRVLVIDQNTKERRSYEAKVIFLCASTIGTAQILLNSRSDAFPRGIANSSDMVGRNLMDHVFGSVTLGTLEEAPNTYYRGRRPNSVYIPRYRNLDNSDSLKRGYGFGVWVMRQDWQTVANSGPAVGKELKERVKHPGPWEIRMYGVAEMLPNPDNRVSLDKSAVDQWGIPLLDIHCVHSENDKELLRQASADASAMVIAAGGSVTLSSSEPMPPGIGIHEMGTARMGKNPASSVLNAFNQTHDIANLYITDGAAMASGGCQNPSLTYMALSARAAHHAGDLLRQGKL